MEFERLTCSVAVIVFSVVPILIHQNGNPHTTAGFVDKLNTSRMGPVDLTMLGE